MVPLGKRPLSRLSLPLVLAGMGLLAPALAAPPKAAPRLPDLRPVKLVVTPESAVLTGPEARQSLLVTATFGDGTERDVTGEARFDVRTAGVVKVAANGQAQAVGDGKAPVTAAFGGLKATASLEVKDAAKPFVWSFRNDVISVLSKAGCSMGSCHGAAAGKNGFRLTLRGYDPDLDYDRLLHEAGARRINRAVPGQSLILLKATNAVPHAGGQRFKPGSREYRVLAEWIAAGMPGPSDKDARLESLEVLPKHRRMLPNKDQRLVVLAHFNDGHVEDVTPWARYSSNEEGVAKVAEDGKVTTQGNGETAVAVFYLDKVTFTTVSVPFPNQIPAERYAKLPTRNFIDPLVLAKLADLRLWPSEEAGDAEFCRRVYLDLIGIIPTSDEVRAFLKDDKADKRERLIDALMQRPEFVDFWAYKWGDLLRVSRESLNDQGMWAFYQWIRDQVVKNRPWNEVVYEILTSSGSNYDDGPSNFYRIAKTPEDLAETTSQAFLGIRVQCARCHNHPFEKWTQNDYYQMANFFSRVGRKNGDQPGDLVIFAQASGNINHPKLGRPLPPKPYDAQPISLDAPGDRREALAKWITGPQNPYFARSIVNRVWRHFLGRGLIEPVDDLRATNPATNEPLLAALEKDLVEHKYDLRHLILTIVNSRTYQLSSRPNPENRKDDRHYSRYFVKRLTAEQLLDAVCQVTGVPEKFNGFPLGIRATQLPDTKVGSYFLDVFGRPPRQITCDCERAQEPNMAQALHLINGPGVNQKISAKEGTIERLIAGKKTDAEIVEELYLACFGRLPVDGEKQTALETLAEAVNPKPAEPEKPAAAAPPKPANAREAARQQAERLAAAAQRLFAMTEAKPAEMKPAEPKPAPLTPEQARRQILEDLLWALINGKEFIFNH
jgi:hypothetical protein